jgi:Lrp/AsnC family leucine-responsive transcriptional regulator
VISLDELDRKILELLAANGRESWKGIADRVGLSAPSVMERVRKLERAKLGRGYTVVLDPAEAGLAVLAFVSIVGSGPRYHQLIEQQVRDMPEVQECHVTSGTFDYLLKIRCASSQQLMDVLQKLRAEDGVQRTETTVTLATLKETSGLTLPPAPHR